VCVTFGVTATKLRGRTITDLLRDTVAAVVSLGAEVVVAGSAAEREEVGELPPGARFAELLPLKLLLPTCSAIVHLGGAGSVLTAAACGVPQLAISLRPEQMLTGDQLVAVGAGRHLVYNDLAEEADPAAIIRAEVGQLLEQDLYRSAAAALSREIAQQPPPSALVETVQSLATGVPA
jgi:glycosyltransferase